MTDRLARASRRVEQHALLGPLPSVASVTITVDGQALEARAGEVIAATLLAHGLRVCRTTPLSGAPRGPFCAVGRCPDCMMIVDGQPSVRTCLTPVRDGMRVETQQGLGEWRADEP